MSKLPKAKATDLPSEVKGVKSGAWQTVVRAVQGNFDHLMGAIKDMVSAHNTLVDDFEYLQEFVNNGFADTASAEHNHDGTDPDAGGGTLDHGTIGGLGDDDHTQYLKEKASGGTAAETPTHAHTGATEAGTLDHGAALTGLLDDDHTIYLKEKASGGSATELPEHTHGAASQAGDALSPLSLNVTGGPLILSGIITAAFSVNPTNNWNPTGLSAAAVVRMSSGIPADLTGIAGGSNGRLLFLHNVGSETITLKDEDALSSGANRFALDSDLPVTEDGLVVLQYDNTDARWRAVGGAGGGASGPHTILSHSDANPVPSPAHGDVLTWDATPGEWVALAPAGSGGAGTTLQQVWTMSTSENLVNGDQLPRFFAPQDALIEWVAVSGEARAAVVYADVQKNGFSIFTGALPDAPIAGGRGTKIVPTTTSVLDGDELQVVLSSVGSSNNDGRLVIYLAVTPT